jgi:hypothetical protein
MNSLICTVNQFIEIIKYTWKAKGRHGIHSPFVYDLMDQCFRKPISGKAISMIHQKTGIPKKVIRCMMQLLDHLPLTLVYTNHALLLENEKSAKQFLPAQAIRAISDIYLNDGTLPSSLIYMDFQLYEESLTDRILELVTGLSEDSIFLIDGIRKKDATFDQWQKLISHPDIHFSADLLLFGMLSKRSFQKKEHFVLRF